MSRSIAVARDGADAREKQIASANAHLARVNLLIERIRSLLETSDRRLELDAYRSNRAAKRHLAANDDR